MNIKPKFYLAALVTGVALLTGRHAAGADVSIEVRGGDDYYGRDYGRPVYYGHPAYREDFRMASPPDRREREKADERRDRERHDAPPPRERDDRRDQHDETTREPRNQHP